MLIDEGFRQWWKKYSALALFTIAVVNVAGVAAWTESPDFQAWVKATPWGPATMLAVNAVVGALGFIGRFVKQADNLLNATEVKSHWLASVAAVLLATLMIGCASVAPPTPQGTIVAAYKSIAAYHDQVAIAAQRGVITPDKADALIDDGEAARKHVSDARAALTACGGKLPCPSYDRLLLAFQERLAAAERRRRQEEARKP